jgi:NAD(P)-dependent dehydrogenase (short-subunit alcohol dehydrogenase family)
MARTSLSGLFLRYIISLTKFKRMKLENKVILITGANRGIGRALVEEALSRGVKRVYAGTRVPFTHPDPRVIPLVLDVTNEEQIREAAWEVGSLDVLINNAGVALYDDLSDPTIIERHLAVNFYGPYRLTQAFLPALTRSRGAIVNILSVVALAPLPIIPSYSISKAAAFSLTQSLRAFLAGRGVRRPHRTRRHRHEPGLGYSKGLSGISRAGYSGRGSRRGRGYFP